MNCMVLMWMRFSNCTVFTNGNFNIHCDDLLTNNIPHSDPIFLKHFFSPADIAGVTFSFAPPPGVIEINFLI